MLIIRKNYFLSEWIFEGLNDDSLKKHDVITHKALSSKGLKHAWLKIKKMAAVNGIPLAAEHFFQKDYIEQAKQLASKHETVLLFDIQNLKDIKIFRKIFPDKNLIVFLWNPARQFCRNRFSKNSYIKSVNRLGITVATFDEEDAKEYGFTLMRQPYRMVESTDLADIRGLKDVFFIGADKNRAGTIAALKELTDGDLSFTIYLQKDKHSPINKQLINDYHDKGLSYEQTREQIVNHRAYLELLQKVQKGTTMRPIEALMHDRKLISSNTGLKNSELYHDTRILVLGPNTTREQLVDFVKSDFLPVARELKEKYDINFWLDDIESLISKDTRHK